MLEEAVLATRGAVTQGEDRERIAAACVRAAVDAESYKEAPRFELARGRAYWLSAAPTPSMVAAR